MKTLLSILKESNYNTASDMKLDVCNIGNKQIVEFSIKYSKAWEVKIDRFTDENHYVVSLDNGYFTFLVKSNECFDIIQYYNRLRENDIEWETFFINLKK